MNLCPKCQKLQSPIQRQTTAGVPNCECGKKMKPTKPGSKMKFYCKHADGTWGKPKNEFTLKNSEILIPEKSQEEIDFENSLM